MSIRLRVAIVLVIIVLAVDGLAWYRTYQITTGLTVEEQQKAAAEALVIQGATISQERVTPGQHISLNGPWLYRQTGGETANYFSPDLDTSAWQSMPIPQNWYLAGLNYHGTIWFRREFQADPAWQGRLVQFQFDGVDYFAEAWLNGKPIGKHQGYFQSFQLDVTNQLRYDGKNVLALRVNSPLEEYDAVYPLKKTLIKGIFTQDKSRPGGTRGLSGQEYNTGGIWNNVSLLVSNFVTLENARLQATWTRSLPDNNDPQVRAALLLRNHSDKPAEVLINIRIQPENFEGYTFSFPAKTVALASGQNTVELNDTLSGPLLWWPWDRGKPNLYRVHIQVTASGQTLASQQFLFGFRQVQVDKNWVWKVNGRPYFPRGTNYASTQWLSQTSQAGFERDVNLMRQANLNFVRLTGHIEPAEFYDVADRAGLLVWQDSPLQGGYSDAPAFIDDARRQAGDMVNLLGNHPSIAIWCMHSEAPWATPEIASQVNNYDPNQNSRLDELLKETVAGLDTTRAIQLSSGAGSARVYQGWSQGSWMDYKNLPGAPFIIEYGAQALPDIPGLMRQFDVLELYYQEGEVRTRWEFQDFQARFAFDVAGIDPGKSTGDQIAPRTFIKNSQDYQANLLQFATETYRRAKYSPIGGIFQYMFVDEWPSVTYSVLDDQRTAKEGYIALQTAMQPVLPSISPVMPDQLMGRTWVYKSSDSLHMALWIINDTLENYPSARLEYEVVGLDGQRMQGENITLDIESDEADARYLIRNLVLEKGEYQLKVTLRDSQGVELGYNEFLFAIIPPEETPAK